MPKDVVEKMVFSPVGILDSSKVLRKMVGETEPWVKLLGRERMNDIGATLQALVTRLYSLPEKSEEFVKRSRRKWE